MMRKDGYVGKWEHGLDAKPASERITALQDAIHLDAST